MSDELTKKLNSPADILDAFCNLLSGLKVSTPSLNLTPLECWHIGRKAVDRITELQAQLADANQVANDCRIVADNAIAEALEAKKDAERLDWIIDNASIAGGGDGFALKVFVPVDCECVRTAIDAAIAEGEA